MLVNHLLNIVRFRETGNLKHSYRNQFDNACFVHHAAYSDSKDLPEKLFQLRYLKIELMKLLEVMDIMDIREH